MADGNADVIRGLRIQTGVVKRLVKEKAMYEQEVIDQRAKIDSLKERNEDEYVVKKQIEVLQESENMIPDCQKRITAAFAMLKKRVENAENCTDSKEYQEAKALLDKDTQ